MNEPSYISFVRDAETKPMIGMFREDLESLRASFPHLLSLTLNYQPAPTGVPADSGEYKRNNLIEDKLEKAVPSSVVLVGHLTGNGRTVILFVSKTPSVAPITVGLGLFKKETFTLVPPHPDPWAWYEANAKITDLERVTSAYFPLYQQLEQHEDDHAKVRPVDFAANFPTDAGREAFLAEVFEQGYVLGKQGKWDPAPSEFWCEFVKEMAIEPSRMGPLVLELEAVAARHGGTFDGWACPVIV